MEAKREHGGLDAECPDIAREVGHVRFVHLPDKEIETVVERICTAVAGDGHLNDERLSD